MEAFVMVELELPYPPSMNHYWRRVGPRTLISRQGRRFRADVVRLLAGRFTSPIAGPLDVRVRVHPPDRRRRDLDNLHKPLLDALQHAGLYADDGDIDRLDAWRCEPVVGGKVVVRAQTYRRPSMEIDGWVILTRDGTVVPGSFRQELHYAFIAAQQHQRLFGGARMLSPLFAAQATLSVSADRVPMPAGEVVQK